MHGYLPPSTVFMIGCCREKSDRTLPAARLYQGRKFRDAVNWVTREKRPWYVVSGRHGLLHPRDIVQPYDFNIAEAGADDQTAWRSKVAEQIYRQIGNGRPLALLMVPSYAALVRQAARERLDIVNFDQRIMIKGDCRVLDDKTLRTARPDDASWRSLLTAYQAG